MKKLTLDLISKITFSSSNSISYQIFIDDLIEEKFPREKEPLPHNSLKSMIQIGKWKKDKSNLGFRDYKKIDGTPNVTLLFVITVTIANHSILGVVIDDGISRDLMYIGTFMKLGLQMQYLKSSECKSMLSLNYSSICLCGRMDLPVSLR